MMADRLRCENAWRNGWRMKGRATRRSFAWSGASALAFVPGAATVDVDLTDLTDRKGALASSPLAT